MRHRGRRVAGCSESRIHELVFRKLTTVVLCQGVDAVRAGVEHMYNGTQDGSCLAVGHPSDTDQP